MVKNTTLSFGKIALEPDCESRYDEDPFQNPCLSPSSAPLKNDCFKDYPSLPSPSSSPSHMLEFLDSPVSLKTKGQNMRFNFSGNGDTNNFHSKHQSFSNMPNDNINDYSNHDSSMGQTSGRSFQNLTPSNVCNQGIFAPKSKKSVNKKSYAEMLINFLVRRTPIDRKYDVLRKVRELQMRKKQGEFQSMTTALSKHIPSIVGRQQWGAAINYIQQIIKQDQDEMGFQRKPLLSKSIATLQKPNISRCSPIHGSEPPSLNKSLKMKYAPPMPHEKKFVPPKPKTSLAGGGALENHLSTGPNTLSSNLKTSHKKRGSVGNHSASKTSKSYRKTDNMLANENIKSDVQSITHVVRLEVEKRLVRMESERIGLLNTNRVLHDQIIGLSKQLEHQKQVELSLTNELNSLRQLLYLPKEDKNHVVPNVTPVLQNLSTSKNKKKAANPKSIKTEPKEDGSRRNIVENINIVKS